MFEFGLADIDPKTTEIDVAFKKMFVVLNVAGDEKLVKSYKNGELQNYQSEIRFLVNDSHEGRMIMDGLKYIHDRCQD